MIEITEIQKEMIEKFQCFGCTCGSGVDEECFELQAYEEQGIFFCKKHSAGTILGGVGKIYLGLPKGFDKVGALANSLNLVKRPTNIRLFTEPSKCHYDYLNVPVWAMEKDGYLFVRVFCPRVNETFVDVIKNGKIKDVCPYVIDVSEFIDEID
jgi:hypothetical protein